MTNSNIESYYGKCIEFMEQIKNPILKECCQIIYKDYKEKLIKKPATIGSHHFFKGGLLYHTYCVTRNALAICNLYPDLEIDLDLVDYYMILEKRKNYVILQKIAIILNIKETVPLY